MMYSLLPKSKRVCNHLARTTPANLKGDKKHGRGNAQRGETTISAAYMRLADIISISGYFWYTPSIYHPRY